MTTVAGNVASTTGLEATATVSAIDATNVVIGVHGEIRDWDESKRNPRKAKAQVEYEVAGLGKDEDKKVAKIEHLFGKINDYLVCTYEDKDDCDKQLIEKATIEKEAMKLDMQNKMKVTRKTNNARMQRVRANPWWTGHNEHENKRIMTQSIHLPHVLIDEPLDGTHYYHPRFPLLSRYPIMYHSYYEPRPYHPYMQRSMVYIPWSVPVNSYHTPSLHTFPESELLQNPIYAMNFPDADMNNPIEQVNWGMPARNLPRFAPYEPRVDSRLVKPPIGYMFPNHEEEHDFQKPFSEMNREMLNSNDQGYSKNKFKNEEKEEQMTPANKQQYVGKKRMFKPLKSNHENHDSGDEKRHDWQKRLSKKSFHNTKGKKEIDEGQPKLRRGYLMSASKDWNHDEKREQIKLTSHKSEVFNEVDDTSESIDNAWRDWENENNDHENREEPTIKTLLSLPRNVNSMGSRLDGSKPQTMDSPENEHQSVPNMQQPLHGSFHRPKPILLNP